MVKEFVLIERQEYDQLKYIPSANDISENIDVTDTVPNASMLSFQQLLNAVKSRVGVRYHNKVDSLFEFLKLIPQYCRGLILVKLLLMECNYLVQMSTTC